MISFTRSERQLEKERLHGLTTLSSQRAKRAQSKLLPETFRPLPRGVLSERLAQGGLSISPFYFLCVAALAGTSFSALSLLLFSPLAAPLFFLIGVWLPFALLEGRVEKRALSFAEDYPAILLATSSSIKVGLTPENALSRATKLLPQDSLARREVDLLLKRLREGMAKEVAIAAFARDFRLPDLDLFRSAFLLVMETGGRFSPTLQRLAGVSANRMTLLKMAGVSTASMRMTGNVLLCIAPGILLFLSMRIQGFWLTMIGNSTANAVASFGALLMTLGFLTLRKMSRFKP